MADFSKSLISSIKIWSHCICSFFNAAQVPSFFIWICVWMGTEMWVQKVFSPLQFQLGYKSLIREISVKYIYDWYVFNHELISALRVMILPDLKNTVLTSFIFQPRLVVYQDVSSSRGQTLGFQHPACFRVWLQKTFQWSETSERETAAFSVSLRASFSALTNLHRDISAAEVWQHATTQQKRRNMLCFHHRGTVLALPSVLNCRRRVGDQ